jgi:hypothetical protein
MKNSQQGFAPIVLIIIVVAIAVAAGVGTMYYKSRTVSVPATKIETSEPQAQTPAGTKAVSTPNQKDCGKSSEILEKGSIIQSFNCLIESAKTCMPTKADITTTIDLAKMLQPLAGNNKIPSMTQTQRTLYEIRGVANGKCVYFTKLLDVQNPNMPPEVREMMLREGEMTCSYDSADLVARLKNVQQGNSSFSFSTTDTPVQRAEKQCQNYGALSVTPHL